MQQIYNLFFIVLIINLINELLEYSFCLETQNLYSSSAR